MLKKNLMAIGLSGLIVAFDQITKIGIKYYMDINQSIPIIGKYIGFRLIENPGIAFGIQIGGKPFFTIFAIIACLVIFIFLFRLGDDNYWTRIALSFILGGAVGNLIDRVAFGKVLDFIEIGPWPIFNIADVAITFGMIILIVTVFFERKTDRESQEEEFEISC